MAHFMESRKSGSEDKWSLIVGFGVPGVVVLGIIICMFIAGSLSSGGEDFGLLGLYGVLIFSGAMVIAMGSIFGVILGILGFVRKRNAISIVGIVINLMLLLTITGVLIYCQSR